jgi:hypothetical protein
MQGVVYWQPPASAMAKVEKIIREPTLSKYGSDDGLPELREALLEKVTSFYHKIHNMLCPYTRPSKAMLSSLTTLPLPFGTKGHVSNSLHCHQILMEIFDLNSESRIRMSSD